MADDPLPAPRNLPPPSAAGGQDAGPTACLLVVPAAPAGRDGAGGQLPAVGDRLTNCRLVAELGRGATGRAFLARDDALAGRPVVLKVSADGSRGEHLTLARLQHTNIMPLYWANTLPDRGLHVLAMPYLASTTLARLLDRLRVSPRETWAGRLVCELLEEDQAALPVRISAQEQPAAVLRQSSWAEFVARVGQTLAHALAFAHKQDILHLDLKPANVLITPDGQPILLDLDIARPPIPAGAAGVPWLGGTDEFMSPEQGAAAEALVRGRPIPGPVDGRSDLYSLGLVLHHALGGETDAAHRPVPGSLLRASPPVPRGLADILTRCLAENPANRYPDCNAMAEDLRRHLLDLPLAGVRNRLPDRWRKWRRRWPLGLFLILALAAFCIAAGTAGVEFNRRNDDRRQRAEAALLDGQEAQRAGQYEAAIRHFLAGADLAGETYGGAQLGADLGRRLRQAQRLRQADELKHVVGLLLFYALQEHTPRRLQWVLDTAGRKLWADRDVLTDRAGGDLEQAAEAGIHDRLQELVVLWADLHVRVAPPAYADAARNEVRAVVAEAERAFGPSLGLRLAARRGGGAAPGEDLPPRAAWEFCALGRAALADGDHAAAARFMQGALDRDPLGFDANFHVGVGALRQKQYDLAARALSFCAGQDPRPECFLLRGQALAALGDTGGALADFDHAVAKNPELGAAYLHRGRLLRAVGRGDDAAADFRRAEELSE